MVTFAVNIPSFRDIRFHAIDSVWESESFLDLRNFTFIAVVGYVGGCLFYLIKCTHRLGALSFSFISSAAVHCCRSLLARQAKHTSGDRVIKKERVVFFFDFSVSFGAFALIPPSMSKINFASTDFMNQIYVFSVSPRAFPYSQQLSVFEVCSLNIKRSVRETDAETGIWQAKCDH